MTNCADADELASGEPTRLTWHRESLYNAYPHCRKKSVRRDFPSAVFEMAVGSTQGR
jgi:hypothetical protein